MEPIGFNFASPIEGGALGMRQRSRDDPLPLGTVGDVAVVFAPSDLARRGSTICAERRAAA